MRQLALKPKCKERYDGPYDDNTDQSQVELQHPGLNSKKANEIEYRESRQAH